MMTVIRAKQFAQGLLTGALVVWGASQAVGATDAAVATAHPLATEAGLAVLEQGGNAFDAAVAVSAVLAVVEPYSSGIGGGGFWLLRRASDGKTVMVDGREKAPGRAHETLFQDATGAIIEGLSMNGALAAGIPGEPAALAHIASQYGSWPLADSLAPAIQLAEQGYEVEETYVRLATLREKALRASAAATEVFLPGGTLPRVGQRITQPDLARTLTLLAEKGHDGFYHGDTALRLVNAVRQAGGIWTLEDLYNYNIVERQPVTGRYRDMTVTSAALPSSGGVVMLEILNQLEQLSLDGLEETDLVHRVVEAMRRAYRDRAEYLGDSDFVEVPVAALLAKRHARHLFENFSPYRATPSADLKPVAQLEGAGNDTTHFSIIDNDGNIVSATLSINFPFGSGMVADGTGVLLNNEMDDFSSRPGTPNGYGLVGSHANAIAPNKRMLSSMSPTILETRDRLAVVGTPGGSRIITMVTLAALAFEQGASAAQMVSLPRFHHQYLPDVIEYEDDAIGSGAQLRLTAMGHSLQPFRWTPGNMQAVVSEKATGRTTAASDPRYFGMAGVIPEPMQQTVKSGRIAEPEH